MIPGLIKLADVDRPGPLLQVLIDEVTLTTLPHQGLRVEIRMTDASFVVQSTDDKKRVSDVIDQEEGRRFEEHCLDMRTRAEGSTSTTTFSNFCLRHGSAGVMAATGSGAAKRYLLFERDIDPVGWNIANGGSHDETELVDVQALLRREAGEEILFYDSTGNTVHLLADVGASEELALAQSLWQEELAAQPGPPLTWTAEEGGDELVVIDRGGQKTVTAGLIVAVNAADFGIECCQSIVMEKASNLIPLDGEILGGKLLDRRVGLFAGIAAVADGCPDALFQRGRKKAVAENRTTALCPVTEKVIAELARRHRP